MKKPNIRKIIDRYKGAINIQGVKNPVPPILKTLILNQVLYVSDGTFYLHNDHLLIPISDKETYQIIRAFLDDDSRTEISSSSVKEIAERLRDLPEVQIDIDEIIAKTKFKVFLKNGIFDVSTGKFSPNPLKDELFLYKLNFNYVKNAALKDAPNFAHFVKTSLGEENLDCFLEWKGYTCTTITDARQSMFYIGPEKCGKSLDMDAIEDALGVESTSSVSFSKIGTEQSRIKYQGKIINLSREASAEPLRNEDAFKSLVAGEKITGRNLYENYKEFVPYVKFLVASNFFPNFKHLDTAILDRMILIYFKDRVSDDVTTDYGLKEKIFSEKDIIYSMALNKMPGLIKSGYQFSMSDRAKDVLASKRLELLNVSGFIGEYFEIDTGSIISSVHLYGLYKEWCNVNAISPEGRNTFYSKANDYSNQITRGKFIFGNRNLNGFRGLKLKGSDRKDMDGQSYQDSPASAQEGGDS